MAKREEKGKMLKDWFGRRAEDSYTRVDNSKKLFNWDKNRSNLSSYFFSGGDSVAEAAKLTGSMFRVMNVDKHIEVSKTNTKKKFGESIKLPLGMLKEEVLNDDGESEGYSEWMDKIDYEKLDAFYGASIQQACKYSLQSASEFNEMMNNLNKPKHSVKSVLSEIINTERLDTKLANKFPGYVKFVQKYKNYTYDKNFTELPETASKKEKLMDTVFKMLRYPAHLNEDVMNELKEPLAKIETLIKKSGGIPETKSECESLATSLSNVIYKFIEEEEEEPPPTDPGDDEDDESLEDSESGSDSGKKPSLDKEGLDELASDYLSKMLNEEESEDYNEEEAKEFNDELSDSTGDPSGMTKDVRDEMDQMSNGKIKFIKSDTNREAYTKILSKIDISKAQVLRKLFERKSKSYDFSMKGMRSGRLDTNKLAEAVQGVPNIYERIGNVTTNKVCVGVLVDESGSMGGTKIAKAREAAIYINEIFKKMHDVEFFVYGHTADQGKSGETQIRIYKEPGVNDSYALGSIEARSNNRDGDAILATALRIRSMTKNPGILFVISDGQPSANGYSGTSAIEDTRKKVTKAQQLEFQIIQIAIDEDVPSKEMFDYFIEMTDIKNLPRELSAYMSNKVDKLIKETMAC